MCLQNNMSGPLPSDWDTVGSLTWLDLSHNQLTGVGVWAVSAGMGAF